MAIKRRKRKATTLKFGQTAVPGRCWQPKLGTSLPERHGGPFITLHFPSKQNHIFDPDAIPRISACGPGVLRSSAEDLDHAEANTIRRTAWSEPEGLQQSRPDIDLSNRSAHRKPRAACADLVCTLNPSNKAVHEVVSRSRDCPSAQDILALHGRTPHKSHIHLSKEFISRDSSLPRALASNSYNPDIRSCNQEVDVIAQFSDMAPVRETSSVHTQIKEVVQNLFDFQTQVHGFVPETQPLLIDKMTELALSLSRLQTLTSPTSSRDNPIHQAHIAPEIVDYVDDGRNPDIFTRDFVELVQRGNAVINGKQKAFRDFSEIFAEVLKSGIEGVAGEVDKVMDNANDDDTQRAHNSIQENGRPRS